MFIYLNNFFNANVCRDAVRDLVAILQLLGYVDPANEDITGLRQLGEFVIDPAEQIQQRNPLWPPTLLLHHPATSLPCSASLSVSPAGEESTAQVGRGVLLDGAKLFRVRADVRIFARLLASRAQRSGEWLSATPIAPLGLYLDINALRIAVGLRLGVRCWCTSARALRQSTRPASQRWSSLSSLSPRRPHIVHAVYNPPRLDRWGRKVLVRGKLSPLVQDPPVPSMGRSLPRHPGAFASAAGLIDRSVLRCCSDRIEKCD